MTPHETAPNNPRAAYRPKTDAYTKALRLSGLLQALAFLTNENGCPEGQAALIFIAEEMAADVLELMDPPPPPRAVVAA